MPSHLPSGPNSFIPLMSPQCDIIAHTQETLIHVQKENSEKLESDLRRIVSVDLPKFLGPEVSTLHRSMIGHATALQVFSFSRDERVRPTLVPLWIECLHASEGLRRMTPDYLAQADHLLTSLGTESGSQLMERAIQDPLLAIRLGNYPRAQALLEEHSPSLELNRYVSGLLSLVSSSEPNILEDTLTMPLRSSLVAKRLTESLKKTGSFETKDLETLSSFIQDLRDAHGTESFDPEKFIEIVNSINLVLLRQGRRTEVLANLSEIERMALPLIHAQSSRDHIEGNLLFHYAILARQNGETNAEMDFLFQAMKKDRFFTTLYYRVAQILHDSHDRNAAIFYELALALSPLDFPTANDYGVFLEEMGEEAKFSSWKSACEKIFSDESSEVEHVS